MKKFGYIVTVIGNDARTYHRLSIQRVIPSVKHIDKIRSRFKEVHGIEFEEHASISTNRELMFKNITDNQDINLFVARVRIFE